MLDREFQQLLLREPRMAARHFPLEPAERRAAAAIHDAPSLVVYAMRLEAHLAHRHHDGGRRVA